MSEQVFQHVRLDIYKITLTLINMNFIVDAVVNAMAKAIIVTIGVTMIVCGLIVYFFTDWSV